MGKRDDSAAAKKWLPNCFPAITDQRSTREFSR
jgi:hypothetical protein